MARNGKGDNRHGPVVREASSTKRIHAAYILITFPSRTLSGAVRQYTNAKNSGDVASMRHRQMHDLHGALR